MAAATSSAGGFSRKELWKELRRDERIQNRKKLGTLKEQIARAKVRRKERIALAKSLCKAERIAAGERVKALRERAKVDLRAAVALEKSAAKGACAVGAGEAEEAKGNVSEARAAFEIEQKFQRDMRRIEGGNARQRRQAPRSSKREKKSESDDEVRGNIPDELVPLFERVKAAIAPSARMSRTEAFLKYAEEHPEEVIDLEDVDAQTDALIAELERQQRGGRRNPKAKRPDDTRLRTRSGKYVAECKFCGCPDGCGCDGQGCGCGEVKEPKAKATPRKPSRPKAGNPAHGLTALGQLTEIVWKGGRRRWPLARAPYLVYDVHGRLSVVYASRRVGAATKGETHEYARSHWGQRGKEEIRGGVVAKGPFRELGRGVSITYTTKKGTRELVDWIHEWGEGARGAWTAPTVVEQVAHGSKCAGRVQIALRGGTYRVTERGIVG